MIQLETLLLHHMLLLLLVGGYLFNAAVGAMLPPDPGHERSPYGYWFRFMQNLAANGHRLTDAGLPGLISKLAAEGHNVLGAVPSHPGMTPAHLGVALDAAAEQENTRPMALPKPFSFLATILAAIGHLFTGFFGSLFNSDEAKQIEAGIVAFIKTDVGKFSLDAVQYASTLVGKNNDEQRAAALASLKADLVAAGKDVLAIGESSLNLFIEMAYTYAKGTAAKLPAALAATK